MFAPRHVSSVTGFWFHRLSHISPQDSSKKQLYTPGQRGTSAPIFMPPTSQNAYAPDTNRGRLRTLIFYAVVLVLGYLVYLILEPFLVPLAWAAILVVVFHP